MKINPCYYLLQLLLFINLILFIMATYPLIFKMTLRESDYEDLLTILDTLVSIFKVESQHLRNVHLAHKFNLMPCILDVNEIIKYKNIKGYIYNSYVLGLLTCKLKAIGCHLFDTFDEASQEHAKRISVIIDEIEGLLEYHFNKSNHPGLD